MGNVLNVTNLTSCLNFKCLNVLLKYKRITTKGAVRWYNNAFLFQSLTLQLSVILLNQALSVLALRCNHIINDWSKKTVVNKCLFIMQNFISLPARIYLFIELSRGSEQLVLWSCEKQFEVHGNNFSFQQISSKVCAPFCGNDQVSTLIAVNLSKRESLTHLRIIMINYA